MGALLHSDTVCSDEAEPPMDRVATTRIWKVASPVPEQSRPITRVNGFWVLTVPVHAVQPVEDAPLHHRSDHAYETVPPPVPLACAVKLYVAFCGT